MSQNSCSRIYIDPSFTDFDCRRYL